MPIATLEPEVKATEQEIKQVKKEIRELLSTYHTRRLELRFKTNASRLRKAAQRSMQRANILFVTFRPSLDLTCSLSNYFCPQFNMFGSGEYLSVYGPGLD